MAVSLAAHVALFVAPASWHTPSATAQLATPPQAELRATLSPAAAQPVPSPAPERTEPTPVQPVPPPRQATAAPIAPSEASRAPPTSSSRRASLAVEGHSIAGSGRLGDELQVRQRDEFPLEVEQPVRLIGKLSAAFPEGAVASGREGTALVWVIVDEEGRTQEAQPVQGQGDFLAAALAAVRTARFEPARQNGQPIRYPVTIEFRFTMAAARSDAFAVR